MTMTDRAEKIPDLVLLATVFFTGACVLVIELMGTRLMAPFFGSGVYTWSALIAVTLAALALGYAFGGRLADRRPNIAILLGLIMAAGLWTLATPMIARPLLSSLAPAADLRVGVLVSSLLLFAPNLFLLGTIGPFVIRLVTRSELTVGSSSGLVFSVSTVGSLVGALGTGFFLVPNFGVQAIFNFCGLLLLMLSGLGFLYLRRPLLAIVIPFLAWSVLDKAPEVPDDIEVVAQQPSFYGQLQVIDKAGMRVLMVDGIGQNYLDTNNLYNIRYLNFISSVIATRAARSVDRNDMLLIGAGAGHLPRLLQQANVNTEVVELDARAISLAQAHFDFRLPGDSIHIADGRQFLATSQSSYDHIVIDAFSSDEVASHLLSREALTVTRDRLKVNGLLAINVTSIISGKDVSAIYNTLRAVFDNVRAFSPDADTSKLASIVFLAWRDDDTLTIDSNLLQFRQVVDSNAFIDGEIPVPSGGLVLTDDFNPLGYYRSGIRSRWQSAMQQFLGKDDLQWMLF